MEIFVLELSPLRGREEELLALLSPQRREKALRCAPGAARLRSIGAGLLLGRYVGTGECTLNPFGRPAMPGAGEFSLSHSGNYALLARSEEPVGVDAECRLRRPQSVLQRAFTEEERAYIGEDPARFLRLWTRKEALGKAEGRGLTRELWSLGVSEDRVRCAGREYALHSFSAEGLIFSAAGAVGDVPAVRTVSPAEYL